MSGSKRHGACWGVVTRRSLGRWWSDKSRETVKEGGENTDEIVEVSFRGAASFERRVLPSPPSPHMEMSASTLGLASCGYTAVIHAIK